MSFGFSLFDIADVISAASHRTRLMKIRYLSEDAHIFRVSVKLNTQLIQKATIKLSFVVAVLHLALI